MTDDNEEVFRRAAEHYPLNTGNPDWEAVRKKMDAHPATGNEMETPRKKNYRPLLLLLLLLVLSVCLIKYSNDILNAFGGTKEERKVASIPEKQDAAEKATVTAGSSGSGHQTPQTNHDPALDLPAGSSSTSGLDVASSTNSVLQGSKPGSKTSPAKMEMNIETPGEDGNGTASTQTVNLTNSTVISSNPTTEKAKAVSRKKRSTAKQKTKMGITTAAAEEDEAVAATHSEKLLEPQQETPAGENPVTTETAKNNIEGHEKLPVSDSTLTPMKNAAGTAIVTAKKNNNEAKKKSHTKHFYAGLLGGIDYSTIKFQSADKLGYSYGVIAGYRINKRFTVETGFLVDKKSYCSDGKYFSTEKLPVPSYAEIAFVTGDCHMYEVPLNVYYRFGKKEKSAWFASTGISSYFMYKEAYVFDMVHYGQTYPYDAVYKTKDNQFAAVINISGGYTHKIGKLGDLRLEPYFKLPVSKVGTGDLPIQSAGINIGFTRFLF